MAEGVEWPFEIPIRLERLQIAYGGDPCASMELGQESKEVINDVGR